MTDARKYANEHNIPLPPVARLRKYGLTEEQFIELWEEQEGRCLICERKFTKALPANIDHSHRTFTVRGLLCGPDNYMLGILHDDAGWCRRAGLYLSHPTASVLWDQPPRVQDAPPEDLVQSTEPSHGE